MKTRKRLLQTLAVVAMAAALGLTSKPAAAATPLLCSPMCADSCAESCDISCFTWGCTLDTCTGNGIYHPFSIDCR